MKLLNRFGFLNGKIIAFVVFVICLLASYIYNKQKYLENNKIHKKVESIYKKERELNECKKNFWKYMKIWITYVIYPRRRKI